MEFSEAESLGETTWHCLVQTLEPAPGAGGNYLGDSGQEMCLAMAQGFHLCSEHDKRICFIWMLKEIKC